MLIETLKKIFRPVYVPLYNVYWNQFLAPKRYHHLYDEIRNNSARRILEIGTWNGNRAIKMIEEAQRYSSDAVEYVGFDLFEDLTEELFKHELSKKPPAENEVKAKLEGTGAKVTLIKGNTLATLPEFAERSEPFDFIFIDGGHNVETIRSDWNQIQKLMHERTIVIFDDYWRNRPEQSAKPVVDTIDTNKFEVEILPEVDCFNNPEFGRLEISFAKVKRK